MEKSLLKRDGFTLLELMVVLVLIAVMAALAIPMYRSAGSLLDLARCYLDQRHIRDTVLIYYPDRPFVSPQDGFGDG